MERHEGFWQLDPNKGLVRGEGPDRKCLGCGQMFAHCMVLQGPQPDTWLCETCLFDPKKSWWK